MRESVRDSALGWREAEVLGEGSVSLVGVSRSGDEEGEALEDFRKRIIVGVGDASKGGDG